MIGQPRSNQDASCWKLPCHVQIWNKAQALRLPTARKSLPVNSPIVFLHGVGLGLVLLCTSCACVPLLLPKHIFKGSCKRNPHLHALNSGKLSWSVVPRDECRPQALYRAVQRTLVTSNAVKLTELSGACRHPIFSSSMSSPVPSAPDQLSCWRGATSASACPGNRCAPMTWRQRSETSYSSMAGRRRPSLATAMAHLCSAGLPRYTSPSSNPW